MFLRRAGLVAGGEPPRQHRQQCGRRRAADDAERQLAHEVGVVDPGDRAAAQRRGDGAVNEQVDVHGPSADGGWSPRAARAARRPA